MSTENRIIQQILVDILNLKHGLEDILLLIQQIRQVEPQEGEDVKEVALNLAKHHIDTVSSVYSLGIDWLCETSGLEQDGNRDDKCIQPNRRLNGSEETFIDIKVGDEEDMIALAEIDILKQELELMEDVEGKFSRVLY